MNAGLYKLVFSKRLNALVVVGEICRSQGKAPGTTRAFKRSISSRVQIIRILGMFSSGALLVSSAWATPAVDALPSGGQVVQGSAAISQSGAQMDINQASQRAVINWQTFDVGVDAKVHIIQPNQAAVLLNRVVTNKPSEIFGKIEANGQVILVNNNGIVFGQDGSASASSFTATTLDISDKDFMEGKNRFTGNGAQGEIVNHGTIEAKNGGYVALLGAKVTNDGKIVTHNGTVALGAADSIAIPMTSSGKIKMELSAGSINAAVENTKNGVIVTEGGDVYLQAAAANNAMATIKQSGQIDTSGEQAGKAIFLADNGEITVDGSITANSTNEANKGGDIIIGRDTETGKLAKTTNVSGAKLESKQGFVETSGDFLKADGVSVRAKEWLLDPTNITIAANGTTVSGTAYTAGSSTYTAGADSIILASDISNTLNLGTGVTIATSATGASAGNIAVNESIAKTAGASTYLTLRAHGDITVAAGKTITSTSGALAVTFNSDFDGNGSGAIAMATGSGITSNGGDVTLGGGASGVGTGSAFGSTTNVHGISLDGANISSGSGNVTLTGTGYGSGSSIFGVSLDNSATITTTTGTVNVTGTGQTTGMYGYGMIIRNNAKISTGIGNVTVNATSSASGSSDAEGIQIRSTGAITTAGGNISVTGTSRGTNGNYNAGIDFSGGTIIAGGSGSVTLIGTGSGSTSLGSSGVNGANVTTSGGSVNITGTSTSSGAGTADITPSTINTSGGNITFTGNSYIGSGTETVNAGGGTVTLQNRTVGTLINLGGVDASGTLGISNAEVDRITAGTLKIGSTTAGNLTVSTAITTAASTGNLYLQTNGSATVNASSAVASGAGLFIQTTGGNITNNSALSGTNIALDNTNGTINTSTGAITKGTGIKASGADAIMVANSITASGNLNIYGVAAVDRGINISGALSGANIQATGDTGGGVGIAWNSGNITSIGSAGSSVLRGIASNSGAGGLGAFNVYGNLTSTATAGSSLSLIGNATGVTSSGSNTFTRGFRNEALTTLTTAGNVTIQGTSKSSDGINFLGAVVENGVGSVLTINGTTAVSGASSSGLVGVSTKAITVNQGGTLNIIGNANNPLHTTSTYTETAVAINGPIVGSGGAINLTGAATTTANAEGVYIKGSITSNNGKVTIVGQNLHNTPTTSVDIQAAINSGTADLLIQSIGGGITQYSGALLTGKNVTLDNTGAGLTSLIADATNTPVLAVGTSMGGSINATTGEITAGSGASANNNAISLSGGITSTGNVNIQGNLSATTNTGVNLASTAPITSSLAGANINIASNGSITNAAVITATGTTGTGANINFTSTSGGISGAGAIGTTTNKNASVTMKQSGTSTYDGAINAANFTKAGTGSLTLDSWLSTLTGGSKLTNISNAYTVQDGGSLTLNSDLTSYPSFSPASVNVNNASTFSLSTSSNGNWLNTAFNFTGGLGGGTMNLGGNPIANSSSTNTFSTSGGATNTVSGGFNANTAKVNFNLTSATSGTALLDGSFAAIAFTQSAQGGYGLSNASTVNLSGGGNLLFKDKVSATNFNINAGNVQIGDGTAATGATTATLDATNIAIASGSKLTIDKAEAYSNAAVISGAGNLIQAGLGTLTLIGNSSAFAGSTTVNAGKTLAIGTGGSLGAAGSTLSLVSNTSNLSFTNTSGTSTVASTISGAGTVTENGVGGIGLLLANNSYTGITTISAGTLQIGNGGTVGTLGTGAVVDNGVLAINHSNTVNLTNGISGTGSILQQGTGSTELSSNNNTFSGGITISKGTMLIGNGGATAGDYNKNSGTGTITLGDANTGTSNIALQLESGTLATGSNQVALNNNIVVSSQGTGTATIGSITGTGNGFFTQINGSLTLNRNVILNDSTSDRFGYNGKITGTGNISITGNRVSMATSNSSTTSNNDFLGDVTIATGSILQANVLSILPTTTNLINNGTFRLLDGKDQAINGLSGSGTVTTLNTSGSNIATNLSVGNNNGNAVFAGTLTGSSPTTPNLNLIKNGTGTQILTGANSYSGTTTINGGVLQIGNGSTTGTLGTGAVIDNANLTINRSNVYTITNPISGTGSLSQIGTGTTILTVNNNYAGATTVSGGTLQVGNAGSAGTLGSGDVTLSNNANLTYLRSAATTIANNISGTGNISATITGATSALTVDHTIGLTSGTVNLVTDSNLLLSNSISTTNTSSSAIFLEAGKSTAAGTSSGGDVQITGTGALTVGTGGRATLMTGSVAGSTGLGIGAGFSRFNSDEVTTGYSTSLAPLGAGVYAIYRESPTITATLNSATKTYDGLAYTGGNGASAFTGLVNGDTNAQASSISYGGAAQNAVNANSYTLTGTGTSALGYTVVYNNSTLTVNKADLSATGTMVYNASTGFDGTSFTSIAGVHGETFTASGTGTLASANVQSNQALSSLGTLSLSAVGSASLSNYNTLTAAQTSVSVTPRALTVTGANTASTYSGVSQTNAAATIGGTQGSDSFTISGYGSGTNASTTAYADNLSLTGTGGTQLTNYTITYTNGGLTIGKADLSATGTMVYNASTGFDGTSFTSIAGVNGETFTASGTGTLASANVQSNQALFSVSGLNLTGMSGASLSNYNTLTAAQTSVSVTPHALTVTGANTNSTYNGVSQTNVAATIVGTQGSDSFSISGYGIGTNASTTAYADNLSLTGTGGTLLTNYSINYTNGGLTIGKAAIGIGTNDVTKTYNGSLDMTGATGQGPVVKSGTLFAGDSLSGGTFTYTDKNYGDHNKTVTTTGVTVGNGTNNSNYQISYVDNTTSTINKAILTASLTGTVEKVYDGLTTANNLVNANYSIVGLVAGEGLVVNKTAGSYASKNVSDNGGAGAVTAQLASTDFAANSGTDLNNYELPTVAVGNVGKITPAALTVQANNSATFVTLDPNGATNNGFKYTGFVNGETETTALTGSVARTYTGAANPAVGTYTGVYDVNLGSLSANNGNYSISASATKGNLEVIAAGKLLVDIAGNTKTYGDLTAENAGASSSGVTASYYTTSSGGFISNLTVTDLGNGQWKATDTTGAYVTFNTLIDSTGHLSAGNFLNVGSYTYGASPFVVSGPTNFNDRFINGGDLTVNAKAITLNTTGLSKVYDGNTNFSNATLGTDKLTGDAVTATATTGVFGSKNAGSQSISFSGISLSGADSGNYSVQSTPLTGTATIAQKAVTLTGPNVTKTYDGGTSYTTSATDLASLSAELGVAGDTVTAGTIAYTDKNAGTSNKSVTLSGLTISDGNGGANYLVNLAGNSSSTISQALITLGTNDVTKVYNGSMYMTGATGQGVMVKSGTLYTGDSLSGGSFAYTDKNAGIGKTVTTSGVIITDGTNTDNYAISYADNTTSTINKASLTLTAVTDSKTYDGNTFSNKNLLITGLLGSDSVSNLSQSFDSKDVGARKLLVNSGYNVNDGNGGNNYQVQTQTANGSISSVKPIINPVVPVSPVVGPGNSGGGPSGKVVIAAQASNQLQTANRECSVEHPEACDCEDALMPGVVFCLVSPEELGRGSKVIQQAY